LAAGAGAAAEGRFKNRQNAALSVSLDLLISLPRPPREINGCRAHQSHGAGRIGLVSAFIGVDDVSAINAIELHGTVNVERVVVGVVWH
jgi:hypothetical protein